MGFFDDFKNGAAKTTAKAAQKARHLTNMSRISIQISEKGKSIAKLHTDIGKMYAEKHKQDYEPEFAELFSELDRELQEMESLKNQLSKIKDAKKCPVCGADVANGALFCSVCGARIQEDESSETAATSNPNIKKCKYCGAILEPDTSFCSVCGKPIEPEENVSTKGMQAYTVEEDISSDEDFTAEAKRDVVADVKTTITDDKEPEPAEATENKIPNGKISPKICPKCGAANDADAVFCLMCGNTLEND